MSNRWLRFVIALLALAAAGAAGYRIFQQEQRRESLSASIRAADAAAESALTSVTEIKAALHAYVAAGQGEAFWTSRAAALLDALRGSLLELERTAAAAGASLTDTLDLSDRLAASEQRARDYVRAGQNLMAGEVIFSEARDHLASLRDQIARTRAHVGQSAQTQLAGVQREQTMLALGAAGILGLAVLVLVAPGRSSEAAPADLSASNGVIAASSPDAPIATEATERPATVAPPVPVALDPPVEVLPAAGVARLSDAAALCIDLARASTGGDISALLERASSVLNASGIIVWMVSEDRRELVPAVSAGYDERLFQRIRSIPPDASNLTAAAFRANAARTSAATGNAAAALAVPLVSPQGPVGVFSAELRRVDDVDSQQLSIATIVAAQLSTLLGSMTPVAEATRPVQQAQA